MTHLLTLLAFSLSLPLTVLFIHTLFSVCVGPKEHRCHQPGHQLSQQIYSATQHAPLRAQEREKGGTQPDTTGSL